MLNDPGSYSATSFDLNDDGLDDVNLGFFSGGAAFISTLTDWFAPVVAANDFDQPLFGSSYSAIASQTRFFMDENDSDAIKLFNEGDTVNGDSSPYRDTFEYLYGGGSSFNPDQFPNVGDGGYVGFEIEIGEAEIGTDDGEYFRQFLSTTELYYGFMNIQHGSIIIGVSGHNNVAFQGAVIPGGTTGPAPVPLPATGLMLLAGLGGLGALRRFRKG